jgi:endoglucanase
MTPELLDKLLRVPGPSGYEGTAANVWRDAASFADVSTDRIGSSIARVAGEREQPLVAIVGHIDEIGLAITHVDEKGFAWFTPIGGWDAQILVGQRVTVDTRDGAVPGVIGRKPVHLLKEEQRKKPVELEGLHIDIGAADQEDALKMVRIGDSVVVDAEPAELAGERVVSRSMDNRLGCYTALEVARRCHERGGHAASVAGVAAVQEEIGINGARTSAYLLEPEIAIVVDVTHATDAPGIDKRQEGDHGLGSGAVINAGSIVHPLVLDLLRDTAEAEGITASAEAAPRASHTDADAFHLSRQGVPTGVVSIPLRYMHSPVEVVQLSDVEACAKLIAAFAQKLSAETTFAR